MKRGKKGREKRVSLTFCGQRKGEKKRRGSTAIVDIVYIYIAILGKKRGGEEIVCPEKGKDLELSLASGEEKEKREGKTICV